MQMVMRDRKYPERRIKALAARFNLEVVNFAPQEYPSCTIIRSQSVSGIVQKHTMVFVALEL